jgi:hypothetical protein
MSEVQLKRERSLLARIFISPEEPRLRAGWRLLIQTILLVVLLVGVVIAASLFGIPQETLNSALGNTLILFIASQVPSIRTPADRRSFAVWLQLDKSRCAPRVGITFCTVFIYLPLTGLVDVRLCLEVDPASVIITNALLFFVVYVL